MSIESLTKAIVTTAEVMGHEITKAAARDMALELDSYPPEQVAKALQRCKREISGRLTLAAVLSRIDDGHVGAEEAWALCPRSEAETVVWTDQICEAFEAARGLLAAGDEVAARMAFRESYVAALRTAREAREQAKWWPSMGHDKAGAVAPLQRAQSLGRLESSHVTKLLGGNDAAALSLPSAKVLALPRLAGEPLPLEALADGIADFLKKLKGGS